MKKNKRYAAVIIDTRPLIDLVDILIDHVNKIPTEWEIILIGNQQSVCLEASKHTKNIYINFTYKNIDPFGNLIDCSFEKHISSKDYNFILTDLLFWERLDCYDSVLIFQHDSKILHTNEDQLEKFLQYDYVGAPWKFQNHGGNGGLSIRNPKMMIEVIKKRAYTYPSDGNEDVYFSNMLNQFPELGKLAPREICEEFSCESIFRLGTWGIHAIDKYLTKEECDQILNQYE